MDDVARAFEWLGVAIIVISLFVAAGFVIRDALARQPAGHLYETGRGIFGRGLLLGLEVFVAADLIRTVAVDATLTSVGVLGLLVVVRTILSFSLDVEIDGTLPWRRGSPPA